MRLIDRIRNAIQYLPRPKRYWLWAVLLLAIPILGLILSIVFWDWLNFNESRGTTVRNVGLIIAALTALPLAIWRGLVAEKQADAAQQGLRNERYQKGAEMLGDEQLSVRLGGIYALQRLAEEYPEEYHVQIMSLFSAFVRHPTKDTVYVPKLSPKTKVALLRDDIQEVMKAIGNRDKNHIALEKKAKFSLDLYRTQLRSVSLIKADLSNANFIGADLSDSDCSRINLLESRMRGAKLTRTGLRKANFSRASLQGSNFNFARLREADLSYARLRGANFVSANLQGANLHGARLWGTNLSFANLSRVIGLTQTQLNKAGTYPDSPPSLYEALDAKTGKPLVWAGTLIAEED